MHKLKSAIVKISGYPFFMLVGKIVSQALQPKC